MKISRLLQQNLLGKLFNHSIVFLINILIVRIAGAELSGRYFNELYLISFFVFLFSAGLDYAAIAWIARQSELSASVHEKLIKVVLFWSALIMCFIWFALPYFHFQFNQTSNAIVFYAIGNLMLILFQGVMSAKKKFNTQNTILIVTNLLFLSFLIFEFYRQDENKPVLVMNGYALLFFIQGVLMIYFSYEKSQQVEINMNWAKFYKHGLYIMLSSIIYYCFLRADNFFVEAYDNSVTLSNYVQCGKIGQYFLYFSSVISSTMLPFIVSENIAADYQAWKKLIMPYVALICAGAIILLTFGTWIYPLVFGASFARMQPFMQILMPGYVCLGVLTLMNAIYIGTGNIRKIFIGDLSGLLILLIADMILVPKYGAMAAAAVSSICYCLIFLYLWADLKNQFRQ